VLRQCSRAPWNGWRVKDPLGFSGSMAWATAYLNAGDKMKAFQLLTDYKRQYFQLMPPVEREKLNALLEKARK